MADKITKDDIFEGDIFAEANRGIEDFEKSLMRVLKTTKDVGQGINDALKTKRDKLVSINPTDSKNLKDLNDEIKKSQVLQSTSIDLKIKEQKLEQQVITTIAKERKEIKEAAKDVAANTKEREKAAKVLADSNNEYKVASKRLKEISDEIKRLSIAEKQATPEFKKLSDEFSILDKKVRAAEESVGQFQRNVGNYPKQLKEMQVALQKLEPGTKAFNDLAQKAGELKDKINSAKDATKAFSSESKVTTGKRLFGQIIDSVKELDFKGAADKAKQFASVISSISFSEVTSGIKNFGTALFNVGKALLANPFTVTIAAIAALGLAIKETYDAYQAVDDAVKGFNETLKAQDEIISDLNKSTVQLGIDYDVLTGKITKSQGQVKKIQGDSFDLFQKNSKEMRAELAKLDEERSKSNEFLYSELVLGQAGTLLAAKRISEANAKFAIAEQAIKDKFREKEKAIFNKGVAEIKLIREEDNQSAIKETKKTGEEKLKVIKGQLSEEQDLRKRIRDTETENIKDDYYKSVSSLQNRYTDEIELLKKQIVEKVVNEEQGYQLLEELRLKYFNDLEEIDAKNAPKAKKLVGILDDSGVEEKKNREAAHKEKLEKEKKYMEELQDTIFDALEKGLARQNALKEAALDRELANRERSLAQQQSLAERGLENTLAFEEEANAKAQLAKEEQKKQEVRQQKTIAFLRLFASFAERDPNTALSRALVETAIATAVTGAFKDGVEDLDGPGTETSDSILARLSKGESVVTAKATKEHSGLPTALNEGKVDEYFEKNYLPKYVMNGNLEQTSTANNFYNSALLHQIVGVNKRLESLEQTIASKREQTVQLDNLGNVIVSQVEKGFKKTTMYKTRKPLI